MSHSVYGILLNLVGSLLKNHRQRIGPEERLSITLLYLAHGVSFQSIARSYKLGKTTVRNIVLETCEVLWTALSPLYVSEPTTSQYKDIAEDFNNLWNMPNCVGAIDGKHVAITCTQNSASMFLMASCDAKYTFTSASVGSYGSQSDGGVFRHSQFGQALLANELPLPPSAPLCAGSNDLCPHFLVGGAAFPLKINLMRPYSGAQLPQTKDVFNYRLSRACVVIENSFGILTARWRVLRSTIECSPKNCEKIVLSCIALHNFIMLSDCKRWYCPDGYADWENADHNVQNGNWRNDLVDIGGPLQSLSPSFHRNAATAAYEVRNKLATFFMNEGAVPFQCR